MIVPRVLVIEDEPRVADFLARGLRAEGYAVNVARDGQEGLEMARSADYAALLLDLMLPRLDGRDLCRELRRDGHTTPILMLTAMDSLEDKVEGLAIGADDYLTKPFAFDELLARLAALIRRSRVVLQAPAASALPPSTSDLVLDREAQAAMRGGRRVDLTGKEFAVLEMLIGSAGRVISRERILSQVWGIAEDPLTNIVDVYIRRLRRKLEEEIGAGPLIVTVRGQGYRLEPQDA
jgi:DNA-binding response OmpR family regulator